MSCAIFETDSRDAAMTRPAQALRALAMAKDTRPPAMTPQTIAAMGGSDR